MIRPIRAIILTEIRQNLHWAALACLITLGLMARALYEQFSFGQSITGYPFALIYQYICPITGLALGLLQMAPDMRRGRWQFLFHRPVSRRTLLFGKIFAGFILYFFSVGLPLMLVIIWVATPNHFPGPFSSNLIGPNLDKFFAGLPWYAAGLLVAARAGRWVGSRLIPIGGAVVAFLYHDFPQTVTGCVAVSFIFTAIILAAVGAAYITGGEMSRSSLWAKASLAFTLVAGWAFVIVICTLFAQAAAGPNFWSSFQPATYNWTQPRQSIGLGDGLWLHIWGNTGLTISDREFLGRPSDNDDWRNHSKVQSATLSPELDPQLPSGVHLNFDTGIHSFELSHLFRSWDSNWFYIRQRQTVEGYDYQKVQYIGSLGPSGFRGPSTSPEPFPEPIALVPNDNNFGLFVWPDLVYRLTFSPPAVQKIFTAAPGDPVLSAALMWYQGGETEDSLDAPDRYVAVRTRDRIHILRGSHEVMTLPFAPNAANTDIALAMTDSGRYVLAFLTEDKTRQTVIENVYYYNADSILEHQEHYHDIQPTMNSSAAPNTDWLGACSSTAFAPLPLIVSVQSCQLHGQAAPWWMILICSVSLLFGAVSAFAAASLLRACHTARWETYIWITLCALLGLAAILAVFSMYDRPRATPCPACGKRRLLTESICPHCHTPAAPPSMRGIEILEPAILPG